MADADSLENWPLNGHAFVFVVTGVLVDTADRREPIVVRELDPIVEAERHILRRRCEVLLSHYAGGRMDFLYTNWYHSHVNILACYPHMPIGKEWIYRLLFVYVCVCTVTDFSTEDKASGIRFCKAVHWRPGHGISRFGGLCSPRSPKSDESASTRATPTRM